MNNIVYIAIYAVCNALMVWMFWRHGTRFNKLAGTAVVSCAALKNIVNHPDDPVARLYAQVASKQMEGDLTKLGLMNDLAKEIIEKDFTEDNLDELIKECREKSGEIPKLRVVKKEQEQP